MTKFDYICKICFFLRYTHITPLFLGQTVPTQLDHKSTISWGNSGYLRFSGIWPFGRSAGCFMGPDCPKWPFLGPKVLFSARNQFFVHILQFLRYHHDQTPKRQCFCVAHVAEQAPGGLQEPIFGPKMARKSDFYAFHCISWHRMVMQGYALYLMVLHSFACNCIVVYGIVLYV